jgi:hypothetical protein
MGMDVELSLKVLQPKLTRRAMGAAANTTRASIFLMCFLLPDAMP